MEQHGGDAYKYKATSFYWDREFHATLSCNSRRAVNEMWLDLSTIATQYQRIRIALHASTDSFYPLIVVYLHDPSLPKRVIELVYNPVWDERCFSGSLFDPHDPDVVTSRPFEDVVVDLQYEIEKHIRNLCLNLSITEEMIAGYEFKKRQRMGSQRATSKEQDVQERKFVKGALVILLSSCDNISSLYISGAYADDPLFENVRYLN